MHSKSNPFDQKSNFYYLLAFDIIRALRWIDLNPVDTFLRGHRKIFTLLSSIINNLPYLRQTNRKYVTCKKYCKIYYRSIIRRYELYIEIEKRRIGHLKIWTFILHLHLWKVCMYTCVYKYNIYKYILYLFFIHFIYCIIYILLLLLFTIIYESTRYS